MKITFFSRIPPFSGHNLEVFQSENILWTKNTVLIYGIHGCIAVTPSGIEVKSEQPTQKLQQTGNAVLVLREDRQLHHLSSGTVLADRVLSLEDGVVMLLNGGLTIRLFDEVFQNFQDFVCGPAVDVGKFVAKRMKVHTAHGVRLYETFLGSKVTTTDELIFFSNGNVLYWFAATEDYMTKVARNFTSNIQNFWLTEDFVVCLLDSGLLEITYFKYLMISHKKIYLGEVWCADLVGQFIVCSDGRQLIVIELRNEFVRKSQELHGVVALTTYESSILVLTENNLIYCVNFDGGTNTEEEDGMMVLADDMFMEQGGELERLLEREIKQTDRLRAEIRQLEEKMNFESKHGIVLQKSGSTVKVSKRKFDGHGRIYLEVRDDLFIDKSFPDAVSVALVKPPELLRLKNFFKVPQIEVECRIRNELLKSNDLEEMKELKLTALLKMGATLRVKEACDRCQVREENWKLRVQKDDVEEGEETEICKVKLKSRLRSLQGMEVPLERLIEIYKELRRASIALNE